MITLKKYFDLFKYTPTKDEAYYLSHTQGDHYSYIHYRRNQDTPQRISKLKLSKLSFFIKILSNIPTIKLLTLTGSISMLDAKEIDDVDFFIITKNNTLFTTRFFVTVLSIVFGIKRNKFTKKAQDKVCFNLWFSEENIYIPKTKQTLYTAHEIAQMRILLNRDKILENFLEVNNWLYLYLPNIIQNNIKYKNTVFQARRTVFENIMRSIQYNCINKTKTKEYITQTQLWFFPEDKNPLR